MAGVKLLTAADNRSNSETESHSKILQSTPRIKTDIIRNTQKAALSSEERDGVSSEKPGQAEPFQTNRARSNGLQQQQQLVCNPTSIDILIGRGRPFQTHPGNILMRRLVAESKDRYNNAHRDLRKIVALDLLDNLTSRGARFLKQFRCTESCRSGRKGGRLWVVATKDEACEKLCHALRAKPTSFGSANCPPRTKKNRAVPRSSPFGMPRKLAPALSNITRERQEPDPAMSGESTTEQVGTDRLLLHSPWSSLASPTAVATLQHLNASSGVPTSPTLQQVFSVASFSSRRETMTPLFDPALQAIRNRCLISSGLIEHWQAIRFSQVRNSGHSFSPLLVGARAADFASSLALLTRDRRRR